MRVANCRGCGKLFNAISNERLCPTCREALENKFQQVKRYLQEKPNSTVDEVSRENEVSVNQIKQWVREERLFFSEDSMQGLGCEKCGKLIRTGRYCDECKNSIASNLQSAYGKASVSTPNSRNRRDKDRDRMRYL